jgi:hypothetical protein
MLWPPRLACFESTWCDVEFALSGMDFDDGRAVLIGMLEERRSCRFRG